MQPNIGYLAGVQVALGAAINPSLNNASAISDIFEAYTLSLILDAADKEDGIVSFENISQGATATFTFRTSPGNIWSTAQNYTYAIINFPNKPPLEVHMGIYVLGTSGVAHECDVAVLKRSEAEACRQGHAHPRVRSLCFSCECKYYTTANLLGQARGFIGLSADLGSKPLFVTNTESVSAEKLLVARGKNRGVNIVPHRQSDIDRLVGHFLNIFNNYKVR